ncbi:MAG: phage major capsid protein, partial [Ectothiorhodospiraceae bacterium]
EFTTYDELFEQSQALVTKAGEIVTQKEVSAEDLEKGERMFEEANKLRERSKMLLDLEAMKAEAMPEKPEPAKKNGSFKTFGEQLSSVHANNRKQKYDPRLVAVDDNVGGFTGKTGWVPEQKQLVENVGADGGFLVFPEFRNELLMWDDLERFFRQRATVIPMSARTITIPTLDQTGAPAAGSRFYGGMVAYWTEEAASKEREQPEFRQVELIAHKLAVYTEASDELLADSAISLEALLTQLFRSTFLNEEEWAFVNGTGAGQPLGIVTANATAGAGPTIVVTRQGAGAIVIDDIFNMVSQFQGRSPVWIAHQSTMPQILSLNGPAGNPSYVWIANGRDGMPSSLMGYPIFWVENAQPLGTMGDLILADLSKYLIGDRQLVTINSSMHYRFRYDLTSWRAVHRVDGRPWLSAPITYRDGATQVSPFVVLDGPAAS